MEVEYKIVNGFPHYRIGNDGSLWSRKLKGGKIGFADIWTKLKTRQGKHYGKPWYFYASISDENFNRKTAKIHILVAEAFLEPRPPGSIVCHKDNDPTNNNAFNLKWGTQKSNMEDKIQFKTDPKGIRNPRAILTEDDIPKIRALQRMGFAKNSIAKIFNVGETAICDVTLDKKWMHIPGGDWRPKCKRYPNKKPYRRRRRNKITGELEFGPAKPIKQLESIPATRVKS